MTNVINRLHLIKLNNIVAASQRHLRIKSCRSLNDKTKTSANNEDDKDNLKNKANFKKPVQLAYKNTFISLSNGKSNDKNPISEPKFTFSKSVTPMPSLKPKFRAEEVKSNEEQIKSKIETPRTQLEDLLRQSKTQEASEIDKPKPTSFSSAKVEPKSETKKDPDTIKNLFKSSESTSHKINKSQTKPFDIKKTELHKKTIDVLNILGLNEPPATTAKTLLQPLAKHEHKPSAISKNASDIINEMAVDISKEKIKTDKPITVQPTELSSEEKLFKEIEKLLNETEQNFADDQIILKKESEEMNRSARMVQRVTNNREVRRASEDVLENAKIEHERKNFPLEVYHDLHGAKPLNLFLENFKSSDTIKESSLWAAHRESVLKDNTEVLPLNGFEESIKLTEEGKLWNFPIDNEQGIESEDIKMPFYEHVLLDHYLDEFPDITEVQNFMKLILHGLSDNPFLSVKEKVETINWYKSFFAEKIDIIKESINIEKIGSI